jgi:hypothetical protein
MGWRAHAYANYDQGIGEWSKLLARIVEMMNSLFNACSIAGLNEAVTA